MSQNSNLSFRSKADVLDVFHLHAGKVNEALEALDLLNMAMHRMGAGEPLRAVLTDSKNPLSSVMSDELVENALFANLRNAEWHLKESRNSLRNFLRVFQNAHALHASREDCHHE